MDNKSSGRRRIPRVARAAGALDLAPKFAEACGVCGPRAHASRIASTSAFSAAKFRSAVAAGDGSPSAMAAGDCSGPGGDASDARGFVDAVDRTSFLSLVSGSGMVMMNFSRPETSQNVSCASRALQNAGIADNRLGLQPYAASHNVKLIEDNMPPEGLLLARPHVNLSRGRRPHRPPPRSFQKTCKGFEVGRDMSLVIIHGSISRVEVA